MSDPVALLTQDHREVESLFEQYFTSSDPLDAALTTKICDALEAHSRVEEAVVYPCLQQVEDGAVLRRNAEDDHRDVTNIVDGIRALLRNNAQHPEQVQRMLVLRDKVAQHVQDEEAESFPALQRGLGAEDLEAVGQRVEQTKRSVIEEMQRRT